MGERHARALCRLSQFACKLASAEEEEEENRVTVLQ